MTSRLPTIPDPWLDIEEVIDLALGRAKQPALLGVALCVEVVRSIQCPGSVAARRPPPLHSPTLLRAGAFGCKRGDLLLVAWRRLLGQFVLVPLAGRWRGQRQWLVRCVGHVFERAE